MYVHSFSKTTENHQCTESPSRLYEELSMRPKNVLRKGFEQYRSRLCIP